MNTFEFKKLAMSDPYSEDKEFIKLYEESSECRQYLDGIRAFDDQLAQAISVKSAPADFKARLKLRHVMERQEQRQKKFRWMSYAAGIMLAVVATFFGTQSFQANQQTEIAINAKNQAEQDFNDLYKTVVQFVNSELGALNTVQATAQARMKSHLASFAGMHNVGELPGLRYSQVCPVGNHTTWHSVMDHGLGLVTAIYFKDKMPVDSKKNTHDFMKVIQHGENSLLLLGDSQEAVDRAEKEIKASLAEATVI